MRNLRSDLNDGDDLTLAMTLISDALHRRITRLRRSLDLVEAIGRERGRQELETTTNRVKLAVDRYQSQLQRQHGQLGRAIDDFQEALDTAAAHLDESRSELAEAPEEHSPHE